MIKLHASSLVFALVAVFATGPVLAQGLVGDSSSGKALFDRQCSVCHSLTSNRIGPVLHNAYGKKAASVPAFNYSKALQSSNIVWDDKTLDQWLAGPQKLIPGQRMNFIVSDAQKRADIIAYLKVTAETPEEPKK